jgi:DNA-binding transcriptional MerR regulator
MEYSIKELSGISGINKITLRSWEERYNFLVAERSKTNIRKYSSEQLLCAINTSALISDGLKISVISKKSYSQINDLINSKFHTSECPNNDILIARIISSAVLNNRDLFDATIYKGFTHLGLLDFYKDIMYIALQKIGLLWSVNSREENHEAFVFSILQEKINNITSEIIENKFSKDIWLMFILSPYIFLDRDDGHFVSLNNTIKMVSEATFNYKTNWSS